MWAVLASVVVLAFAQVETKAVVQRITRGKEDSFALKASSGCPCDAFNGSRRFTSKPDECLCRCPSDAPTFYTKEGEAAGRCLDNTDVFSDAKEICRYHFVSEGIRRLVVIDLHDGNKSELWPRLGCQNLEVQHWQYRHNGTWKDAEVSSNQIFSSSIIQRKPFLQWEGTTDKQYQGLLIKANLSCSSGTGGTKNECVMFKTNGTQTVFAPVTKSPTKTTTVANRQEGSTVIQHTGGLKRSVVIGLAVAGAVILMFVIILVVVCICRKKRNTRKARTRSVQKDIAPSPAHVYECIQYPVTGTLLSENLLYESGPDNHLVIKSRGSSTSPRQLHSVDVTAQLGSEDFLLTNISRATSRDTYQSLSTSASSQDPRNIFASGQERNSQGEHKFLCPSEPLENDGYEVGVLVPEHQNSTSFKNVYQSLKKPEATSDNESDGENRTAARRKNQTDGYTLMSGEAAGPTKYQDMNRGTWVKQQEARDDI